MQREDDLFTSSEEDYKPQLTAEELNALDAQADQVEAALSCEDELEPIGETNDELEPLDGVKAVGELEGIDE